MRPASLRAVRAFLGDDFFWAERHSNGNLVGLTRQRCDWFWHILQVKEGAQDNVEIV